MLFYSFVCIFLFFFFLFLLLEQQIETLRAKILLIKCLFLIEGLLCFQKLVGKKFRTPEYLNKQLDLNDYILISSLSNFAFLY